MNETTIILFVMAIPFIIIVFAMKNLVETINMLGKYEKTRQQLNQKQGVKNE